MVTGRAPLRDVWRRDYWGAPLASSESHKSWRPATTLTFRFDYRRATTTPPAPHPFHAVNVALHAQ